MEQREDAAIAPSAPWAVILDVDETLLDNSLLQGKLLEESRNYDPKLWNCWLAQRAAGLVAGAEDLFRVLASPPAVKRGVRAILITNRACEARGTGACPQKAETLDNLNTLLRDTGYVIRPEEMLMKNDPDPQTGKPRFPEDEKKARRDLIASTYRIVMLFGDDLGDFYPKAREMTVEQRLAAIAVAPVKEWWGTRWFQLPNPMYGSWERALTNSDLAKNKAYKTFSYVLMN